MNIAISLTLVLFVCGCWTLTPEEKKRISEIGWWGIPPPGKHHPFYDINQ